MDEWDKALFDTVEQGKRIANFADESMFVAEKATARTPKVTLIHANNDPLGQLAQLAQMYQGKSRNSLEDINDADREYYIQDMEKNILGMPSEAILFHFLIENVTRSWTHQLVRTRHASYAQESLRFAVKEDFPVALPPSLLGTRSLMEAVEDFGGQMGWCDDNGLMSVENFNRASQTVRETASTVQRHRFEYDEHNDRTADLYLRWIDEGMPAEDARYITPHGILTKVNMVITLRALMQMAGQRLCTQAQFEHRVVWDGLLRSIRQYGKGQFYRTKELPKKGVVYEEKGDVDGNLAHEASSEWQFHILANRFLPICYQTGECQFQSDFDRYCNIRDRVQANAAIHRPSKEWGKDHLIEKKHEYMANDGVVRADTSVELGIPAINPQEWLDPNAAIRPDGNWRSKTAQDNIRHRRL